MCVKRVRKMPLQCGRTRRGDSSRQPSKANHQSREFGLLPASLAGDTAPFVCSFPDSFSLVILCNILKFDCLLRSNGAQFCDICEYDRQHAVKRFLRSPVLLLGLMALMKVGYFLLRRERETNK